MRHPLLILSAAAAVLATVALPATAAALSWISPGAGAVVTGAVEVAVRVERQVGETVNGVQVRLSVDGERAAAGTATRELACAESDGCNVVGRMQDRWAGVQLGPAGGQLATGAVCNGQFVLQARLSGASHWAGIPVVLSDRAVHAVTGFTADGEPREARLTWSPRSTSPDVWLQVERRSADSSRWELVRTLPGTASAYTDRDVPAGTYDYRVVATRGDGMVEGRPVPACSDTEADLVAASAARRVAVAPAPAPSPTSSSTEGTTSGGTTFGEPPPDGGGRDGTTTDGEHPTTGDTTGDTAAGDHDGADGATAGGDRTTAAPRTGRTRIAAPPPARRPDMNFRAPQIAAPRAAEDTAFGEDGPFSEEIDYGDREAIAADPSEPGQAFLERVVPGGWASVTELDLDLRRILSSVATGLLLMASGLHLRRWMGETRE